MDINDPDPEPDRPVKIAVDALQTQQQAEVMKELWGRLSEKQRLALMAESHPEMFGQ
jgi:hypothetical protein